MSEPLARSSLTPAMADKRASDAKRSSKSWIQPSAQVQDTTLADARETDHNVSESQKIVGCVTRFATTMCVVIAVVKVIVYMSYGRSPVVKTSALDSLGDLVANCITLYTGYRMGRTDKEKYPAGQKKFEAIGVIVFSTLMAAMMISNILNNFEELIGTAEVAREEGIKNFLAATLGEDVKNFDVDKAELYKQHMELKDSPLNQNYRKIKEFVTANKDNTDVKGAQDLLQSPFYREFFKADVNTFAEAVDQDSMTADNSMLGQSATQRGLIHQVADVALWGKEKAEFWQNIRFLMMCATYKFCLWNYCLWVAIPKTGSTVLIALAGDKRNDFVATTFGCCIMGLAYYYSDSELLGVDAELFEPIGAIIISIVIVYMWVDLVSEQAFILAESAGPLMMSSTCLQDIKDVCRGTCADISNEGLKCYVSSSQHTIEATLDVKDPEIPFNEVEQIGEKIKTRLLSSYGEDIERVLVFSRAARQ